MSAAEKTLAEALAAYDFGAPVVGAMRYGCGHINDTFCVHTQPADDCCNCFILQRMSAAAFKHPDQLMANIVGVTDYLGEKIIAAGGADLCRYGHIHGAPNFKNLPDSLLGVPLCLTSSDYLDFKPYFICDLEAPHA